MGNFPLFLIKPQSIPLFAKKGQIGEINKLIFHLFDYNGEDTYGKENTPISTTGCPSPIICR